MPISNTLFLNLVSRMENGFGRLEEGQRLNRLASEERTNAIHKRIDKLEDKIEKHREAVSPSKISYLKVAGSLLAHWQIILTVLLVAAGLALGKSPDTIKAWVGALK